MEITMELIIWIAVISIISLTVGVAVYLYYRKPKEVIVYKPLETELEQIMGELNSLCGVKEYGKVCTESFGQFVAKVKQVYGISFNDNWTIKDYVFELKKAGINGEAEKLADIYNEARYSHHNLDFEKAGASMKLFYSLYKKLQEQSQQYFEDEEEKGKKKPKIINAEVVD